MAGPAVLDPPAGGGSGEAGRTMRICALIPVYNEADIIADLVAAVRPQVDEVVVVDDGSQDGTGDRATRAGALCLRLDQNQGKGAAVRHALGRITTGDFTHVLFMDGDGQHRPEDIRSLVEQAEASGADLVIGARALDRSRMPRSRHFSNTVGSRLASWLVGRPVLDSQCGFRLIRIERLKTLRLRARRYELEMEMLIKLCRQGASVAHAPVALIYDGGRARSKMHPIRDTIRICLWSLAFRYLGV
jgi:glycosyltransferase involved in cell wall biosynthesis